MHRIIMSLCLVLLLCGCVKVDIGMNMEADGSGTFEEQVVVKKIGLAEAGLNDNVIDDMVSQLNITNDVTLEDIEVTIDNEDYIGKKLSFDYSSYSDLQDKLTTVFSNSANTDENTNDNVNKIAEYITIDGDMVHLDMPAETFISGIAGESQFGYDVDATFYLEMNDIEVESSNADRVTDSRFEWDLMDRSSNIEITFKRNRSYAWVAVIFLIIAFAGLVYLDRKGNNRGVNDKNEDEDKKDMEND